MADIASVGLRDLVSLTRPGAIFDPAINAHCLDCREPIAICGYCDHPNRHTGIHMVCSNCQRHIATK